MENKNTFKIGDKIIDFGQVFWIFEIKRREVKGKEEKIIYFRHYFKTPQNKNLVYSIPIKNIGKAHIRRPIQKKELKEIFSELSKKAEDKERPINTTRSREELSLNDAHKTARVLRALWFDRENESTSFTEAKKNVFGLAMERLVEEAAFINDISTGKARRQIKAALEREMKNDEDKEI